MKRLDTVSLRRNVTTYIAVAMLILIVATATATAFLQQHRQAQRELEYSTQVHKSIEHTINHYFRDYSYRVRRMVEAAGIVEMIEQKDRENLYNTLIGKWQLMQDEEEYLKIMHIHLADGTSFMRMHKKELFGDYLSDIRPMIKEIHTSHKLLKGYETGKYGNVYRIIYPIFNKEKRYIGAMELGLNPNFILRAIHEINGFCGMMFIKEKSLKLYSMPSDRAIDGYRLQSKLTPELKNIYEVLKVKTLFEDSIKVSTKSEDYKTHLFVLNDFEGNSKVKILFFQNISEAGIFRSYLLIGLFIAISLILSVLVWFIYRRLSLYQNDVSHLYQEQIQRIDESENRFRLLYEKAPEAYQSLDIDGNLLIVNAKWCEEMLYSQEEVIGKNFGDFIAPEYQEHFKENFPRFKELGGITGVEFEVLRKDKSRISIVFNGKIVYDEEGNFKQTHCIFANITKSKILKEKAQFNQNYLQSIFEVTPSIMITTNGSELDRANPAMLEFFGFETLDNFKREHSCVCDYFLGDNDCIQAEVGEITWLEYILIHKEKLHKVCMMKDSLRYHFVVRAESLEIDEKHRSVVYFTDVTEIQKLSDRYEYAITGANDGLWDWNVEVGTTYFSPRWKSMLGYENNELSNDFKTWEGLVHPDDLEQTISDIQKSHQSTDEVYENIHRLRHKDGHWVWILTRGKTIFNKAGKAIRMVGFHTDITAQKELEAQLYTSRHQFEQFMEYMPANIIIKDENFRVLYANSAANKLFKRESMVGMSSEEIVPIQLLDTVNMLDAKILKNGVSEKIIETQDEKGDKLVYRNLGFKIMNNDKVNIGVVSVDITKEYLAQHEIAKLKSALERSPVSIMMTDIDGNIEYVNPNYTKVSGYALEELIGKNPRIVKSGETSDEIYANMWKHISSGHVWSSDVKNIAKDGSIFWEDSTIIPSFNEAGKVDGYIAFKLEITHKMYLEQELRDKEEIMIAQSRHAAMGEMISMIAHQWRQPISVIAMDANNILADIELETLDEVTLQNGAEDIIHQTQELSKTIDDFRNFFRPEKISQETLVKGVIDDALGVIGKSLENNNVEVILDLDENRKIKTYSRELMQVLINIVKNAKEVLIEKEIDEKKISIFTYEKNDSLILKVCDNAGGVDAAIIEKIFDPYFTTKGEKNGTGLGLYMSRTIVEKHLKGSLSIENEDEGACFTIALPFTIKEDE